MLKQDSRKRIPSRGGCREYPSGETKFRRQTVIGNMGKVQIELSERHAISILGTLDEDVHEVESMLEDDDKELETHLRNRLELDNRESVSDFRTFGRQVKEQMDEDLWEELAFMNKDKLE